MASIRDPQTFAAGLLLSLAGALGLGLSLQYRMGSALDMGPGYFPAIVGGLLLLCGLVALLRSLTVEGESLPSISWKPVFVVLAGIVVFGLLLESIGLAAALLALTLSCSLAHPALSFRTALIIAAALIVFSSLVFVTWLGTPVPIIRGII